MKTKLSIAILSVIALLAIAQAAPLTGLVSIAWDYPTNQLSSNLTFKVYGTNSLGAGGLTNWLTLTNIVGTSTTAKVQLPGGPQQYFLAVTASNQWGESPFSNILPLQAPPAPPGNTRLISVQ